ncbi:MAG: hemerythrin domain-containing protein [Burkholderiales bacterium]|nr:hemerythrin domain-containing protein [Burkholderiales bacterium]
MSNGNADFLHPGFGIPELDLADRDMVAQAHVLNQVIAEGGDAAEIQRQANRFLREAVNHFKHEEQVLWECGYPLLKGHAALHAQMLAELEHAREALCSAERRAAWTEYGLLIKQLVSDHFRQEAMKYRDFLGSGRRPGSPGA